MVQGYLVYKFFTVNTENQTGYITLIDAGNGNEFYTSEGKPISSFIQFHVRTPRTSWTRRRARAMEST